MLLVNHSAILSSNLHPMGFGASSSHVSSGKGMALNLNGLGPLLGDGVFAACQVYGYHIPPEVNIRSD